MQVCFRHQAQIYFSRFFVTDSKYAYNMLIQDKHIKFCCVFQEYFFSPCICKSNLPFPLISIMQCAFNESKNRKLVVWERCSIWTCLFVLDCCLQHVRSSQLSRPWCEFWNFIKGPFNFVLCGDITFFRHPLPPLSLSITNLGCPLPPPPVTSFLSNPISVCWPSFMTNNLQFKRYFSCTNTNTSWWSGLKLKDLEIFHDPFWFFVFVIGASRTQDQCCSTNEDFSWDGNPL